MDSGFWGDIKSRKLIMAKGALFAALGLFYLAGNLLAGNVLVCDASSVNPGQYFDADARR